MLVRTYFLMHGKLHLPGAGWLLRRLAPWFSSLRAFPLPIPNVGTAVLNFGDESAFGVLNMHLGEHGDALELIQYMDQHLKPDLVLWDVGANVGFLCMYFASHHPELAAIHAFEPNPKAFKPLQLLFKDQPKVRVHAFGLGRTDEQLEMSAVPSASTLGSLAYQLEGGQPLPVTIRAGDVCREELQIPPPDVLKIDVEGLEPHVLAGLAETIRQKRPVIFFEHTKLADDEIRASLPPGYNLQFILKGGGLSPDFSQRTNSSDAIMVPANAART